MVDRVSLLKALQRELGPLEDDIRRRVTDNVSGWDDDLRAEHAEAVRVERTASTYAVWRDEQVTQAAVSWLLACVFVRFCEDNGLVSGAWLAGPDDDKRAEAADAHADFLLRNPTLNDRDWLLRPFAHLRRLPATAALFDEEPTRLWLTPSADAAERLVRFWRGTDSEGQLAHRFADPAWDTRFLGDLYQDLSPAVRDTYALLQTPVFVEEFILDRTLQPALDERGVDGLTLIDPTCGSGHFLLGAFQALLARWQQQPGLAVREQVRRALDGLYGVDLNPFAVAIARFRLIVAALRAEGSTSLEQAPDFHLHLAVGDSLLHGVQQLRLDSDEPDADLGAFTYGSEDLAALRAILTPGRYDVVVGNPPYITAKDKALNAAYRDRYTACKGKYALSVPFAQRFFELARTGDGAGYVGQITSNSFMKREFGSELVEDFLARRDLTAVIDTSGAYIPGHGTPTVILVGRNRQPVAPTVRAVLGIRGEPSTPADPTKGLVWRSIVEHIDEPGSQTAFVTVADLPRSALAQHPWSLSGGGASVVMESIGAHSLRMRTLLDGSIGFASFPGLDEAFLMPPSCARRRGYPEALVRSLIIGETVRDWDVRLEEVALVPRDRYQSVVPLDLSTSWARDLWPLRSTAEGVIGFGGQTVKQRADPWWGWYRWVGARYRVPLSIAFAFVATHNHFVLDRGGKVFKQSAPVIKLPAGASEEDHLRLLGLLNSSTACFWLQQMSHNKGRPGAESAGADERFEMRYEFTGTKLEEFPLPNERPLEKARLLDSLAQELAATTPAAVVAADVPTRARLEAAAVRFAEVRARMIGLQEELDWETYGLYGLIAEDLTFAGSPGRRVAGSPGLAIGERAFEIVLARQVEAGEEETVWFTRHQAKPLAEVPVRWPQAYADLVRRRIEVIETRPDLALIERAECKRRWATEPWAKQETAALRDWLLDRLEAPALWSDGQGRPRPQSIAALADKVARDAELVGVLALWSGESDVQVPTALARLLDGEAVPYLAAYRYTPTGLRKRADWEATWELQRAEDRGERLDGPIPVPPKYGQADFAKPAYWKNRGKLDVAKERFVLYPGAGRDTDPTPVLGWAGWDHLAQTQALATLVGARRDGDGWGAERLTPLLAGVAELEPWLHQWHDEPDPLYGGSPAAWFTTWLSDELASLALARGDVAAWRPEAPTRGRKRKL